MTRRQKDPLRPLTPAEATVLAHVAHAPSSSVAQAARATILLSVAAGHSYDRAAYDGGRRSPPAVAALVAHFNRVGLAALDPPHGGGPPILYSAPERARASWPRPSGLRTGPRTAPRPGP